MSAVLLLPLAVFFLAGLGRGRGVLPAAGGAAAGMAAFTLLGCEALSLFSAYAFWPLLVYWLAVTAAAAFLLRAPLKAGLAALKKLRLPKPGWPEWLMLGCLALLALGTLAGALLYPPMNYDSQTYHLPRVFFWLKNASVHNYPTTVSRQLYTSPFAEYGILQLQVLNLGSDVLANCVQWLGYVGSLALVGGIAGQLGASRRGQLAAALLAATAPVAILQARTTQTDLLAAFWCLLVVYNVLCYLRQPLEGKAALWWAVLTGVAGGAAVLTKSTSYAVLLPFAVFFVVVALRRKIGLKRLAALAGAVLLCVVLFNGGFYLRNALDLSGDILGASPAETGQLTITEASPRYRAAAFVMNLGYNFGSQSRFLSHYVDTFVLGALEVVGIPNGDPGATMNGTPFTALIDYPTHDLAANPLHCLLLAAALVVVLVGLCRKKGGKLLPAYALCCAAAFLLVCAIAKWTPDAAGRYTLPAVLLGLAFVPVAFGRGGFGKGATALALAACLWGAAGPLLLDYHQPLVYSPRLAEDMGRQQAVGWWAVGREAQRRGLLKLQNEDDYFAMMNALKASGAHSVGLHEEGGYAVYPALYPLQGSRWQVYYLNGAYHEEDTPAPDAIWAQGRFEDVAALEMTHGGVTYRAAGHAAGVMEGFYYVLLLPG